MSTATTTRVPAFPGPMPSISDPASFDVRGDATIGHLPTWGAAINTLADEINTLADELDVEAAAASASAAAASGDAAAAAAAKTLAQAAAAAAVAAPGTSASSTTSLTVGAGSKSLTIEAGKSLVVGMSVKIAATASPGNWLHGDVTAYNGSTGALTVNVSTVSGSGTFAAWTVSLSAPAGGSADWSTIANKPTTISGYGITDAAPKYGGVTDKGSVSTGTVTFDRAAGGEYQRLQAGDRKSVV